MEIFRPKYLHLALPPPLLLRNCGPAASITRSPPERKTASTAADASTKKGSTATATATAHAEQKEIDDGKDVRGTSTARSAVEG